MRALTSNQKLKLHRSELVFDRDEEWRLVSPQQQSPENSQNSMTSNSSSAVSSIDINNSDRLLHPIMNYERLLERSQEVKVTTKDSKKMELEVHAKVGDESESSISEIAKKFSVQIEGGETSEFILQFDQRSSREINIDNILGDIQYPSSIIEPPSVAASPPQIIEAIQAEETTTIAESVEEQPATEIMQARIEQPNETTFVTSSIVTEVAQEGVSNISSIENEPEGVLVPLSEDVLEKESTLNVVEIIPQEVGQVSTAILIQENILPNEEIQEGSKEITKEELESLQLLQPKIMIDYIDIEELEAKCVESAKRKYGNNALTTLKKIQKRSVPKKRGRKPKEKNVEEKTENIEPPKKKRRMKTTTPKKTLIQRRRIKKNFPETESAFEKEQAVTQEERFEKEKVVTPVSEEKAVETEKIAEHPFREQLILEAPQQTIQKQADKFAVKETEFTDPMETLYSKELCFEIPIHQSSQEFITEFSTAGLGQKKYYPYQEHQRTMYSLYLLTAVTDTEDT
ncbi:3817_t:CDS:2 [Ambispora gerdemannii]|uniref:3817_t:CDS:1 n=1 Tax=Ambispora gerdemannii TaxID=144530 RepID=A0A9N9GRX7_9GLOM|nr:3817_t:CDS:2 [Ambispora gerdemannii]